MQDANKVTTETYWDSVWRAFSGSEELLESHYYYGRHGIFTKLISQKLGDIRDQSVLELGGGGLNFRLLVMAKWLGAKVTALDYSTEGLEVLRRLFAANGCEGTFIQQDISDWQPEQKYDLVTHWGVAEHFLDPRQILEKSVISLKPGGKVLFSMPNMTAVGAALWRKWAPDNWSKHVLHDSSTLQAILVDLGATQFSAFHFGIPMVKIADWEQPSLLQLPVNLLQKVASASARVAPVFHRVGHSSFSMERGFMATVGV